MSKPSKCLQLLLSRTQRMQTWRPLRRTEPSEHQKALLYRMDTRRWMKWSYENTLTLVRDLAGEIKFIKHVENCRNCLLEMQLDVERYAGSRSVWYLDIRNEEFTRQDWRYKDMPYPGDYKIGSYWTGSSEDTIRFIKDRFQWAEKITRKEIMAAVKYLKLIMSWDIDWEPSLFWGETMGRFNDPRVLIRQISALNPLWRSEYDIENIVKMSESTVRLCSRRRFAKINIDITLNDSDLYNIKAYQLKECGLWLALIYNEQGLYVESLDTVLQTIMEKAKQTKLEDYRPIEEFI